MQRIYNTLTQCNKKLQRFHHLPILVARLISLYSQPKRGKLQQAICKPDSRINS